MYNIPYMYMYITLFYKQIMNEQRPAISYFKLKAAYCSLNLHLSVTQRCKAAVLNSDMLHKSSLDFSCSD